MPASRASSGPSSMQVPLNRISWHACADCEVVHNRLGVRLSPPVVQAPRFAARQTLQNLW